MFGATEEEMLIGSRRCHLCAAILIDLMKGFVSREQRRRRRSRSRSKAKKARQAGSESVAEFQSPRQPPLTFLPIYGLCAPKRPWLVCSKEPTGACGAHIPKTQRSSQEVTSSESPSSGSQTKARRRKWPTTESRCTRSTWGNEPESRRQSMPPAPELEIRIAEVMS